jgi:hypothetical protein
MPKHKFKIGQRLFLSSGSSMAAGAYVVIKLLPKDGPELEYQIRSVTEHDERVVRESQLKPSPWRNQAKRRDSAA